MAATPTITPDELIDRLPSAAALRAAIAELESRREALLVLYRAAAKRDRALERERAERRREKSRD